MSTTARSRGVLWVCTIMLFAYFAVRMLSLTAFPPFLDEVVHVRQAEQSLAISPVAFAAEGRLFTLWLHMIFRPHQAGTIWLMRIVHILAILPGFAAAVAVGRSVAGRTGVLMAGFVLLASPLHIFFERLALADPLASAWIIVAVFFALRSTERFHWLGAMACGLALFVAIMFKATVIPALVMVPLAAVSLFRGGTRLGPRVRWLMYASMPVLILLPLVVIALRIANQDHFAFISQYTAMARTSLAERLAPNLALVAEQFGIYLLPMLLGLTLVLFYTASRGKWRADQPFARSENVRRTTVFVSLLLLTMLVAYTVNERLYTRYLILPASLFLLMLAAMVAPRLGPVRVRGSRIALVVLIGVALLYPTAFTLLAYNRPAAMPLSVADFREYVTSSASGFGLAEAVELLLQYQPTRVIGVLANCQGLRFLAGESFAVECPPTNPSGADRDRLSAMMEQSRLPGVYVLHEPLPFVPASVPGRVIASFARPGGSETLTIYEVGRED